MSGLLVDTGVWSLAYRRDTPPNTPQVSALRSALVGGERVAITGMTLLELLRGFIPARAQERILTDLAAVDLIEPNRDDYVAAARLGNSVGNPAFNSARPAGNRERPRLAHH